MDGMDADESGTVSVFEAESKDYKTAYSKEQKVEFLPFIGLGSWPGQPSLLSWQQWPLCDSDVFTNLASWQRWTLCESDACRKPALFKLAAMGSLQIGQSTRSPARRQSADAEKSSSKPLTERTTFDEWDEKGPKIARRFLS